MQNNLNINYSLYLHLHYKNLFIYLYVPEYYPAGISAMYAQNLSKFKNLIKNGDLLWVQKLERKKVLLTQ